MKSTPFYLLLKCWHRLLLFGHEQAYVDSAVDISQEMLRDDAMSRSRYKFAGLVETWNWSSGEGKPRILLGFQIEQ